MMGAAAYACVMTRTVSISFLVIDLTGQINIIIGILTGKNKKQSKKIVFSINSLLISSSSFSLLHLDRQHLHNVRFQHLPYGQKHALLAIPLRQQAV